MAKRFLIYFLLKIFLKSSVFCQDIEIWEFKPESILDTPGVIYTGANYLNENLNYIVSYKKSKSSFIENKISGEKVEIDDSLSPFMYKLNCGIHIMLTENNLIFTNINSKFTKIEIVAPEKNKSLKASLVNDKSEFLISLIGTNKMILFYSNDNKLEKKKEFDLDQIEIISFFDIYFYQMNYIYLIYKNNNIYYLGHYTFYAQELSIFSKFKLNIFELYQITEMYCSINAFYQASTLILFSYNKNENNFIFYLFEYDNNNNYILIQYGNKYNFLPFRNAKILKAFFLPNTELLFYLIQIENEKYAGVLDIINNIIIYNFKTTSEFISFQDSYLLFGENSSLKRVCPFNTKDIKNCFAYAGYSRQTIQINSKHENSIIYKCSKEAPYSLAGIYCFEICPFGYYISGTYCAKCPIFDIDSKKCINSCKEEQIYDKFNGICFSCKFFSQYKNKEINECVDDCSKYNLVKDDINYICYSCKEFGLFLQDDKCVENCGPAHIIDKERFLCVFCKKETPYYQDGECVKECSKIYTLDIKSKTCILCSERTPYLQDGECVAKCDNYHKRNDTNKICINCRNETNDTQFLQDNECVEKCDKYHKIDDINYICINCKEDKTNQFLEDNECVNKCSNYYKIDETNKICINCERDREETPYYQEGDCVKNCSINYQIVADKKICLKCQTISPNTPYLQENICVNECNKYYVTDKVQMRCYNCSIEFGNDYYFYDGNCIKDCPNYFIKDENNKRCYKCEEENSKKIYYEDGYCVEDCTKYYFKDEKNKICQKCGENLYFQDNKCVNICNEYYFVDEELKICYNCSSEHPNKPFYMENNCVHECDSKYAVDKEKKACFRCKDKYSRTIYNENGECVQKCSEKLITDYNDYICINCTEKNNSFSQENKCVEKCNPGYMSISYDTKTCINCFQNFHKYEYNGECVSICPDYYINNEKINKCQLCQEFNTENKYLDIIENKKTCVNKCQIGEEKDEVDFICKKCLYFYNNSTKHCVDNCPKGSEIIGKICEKCKIYDSLNNLCVSECPTGNYPFYFKEDDYSLCYQGFCGYGKCLLNNSNYKILQKESKINNLYSCTCEDISTFGKLCQYKYKIKNQSNNNILLIKPLQDIVYSNKKNIFTFEYKNNINLLRNLLIEHNQFIIRRFEFFVEWNLIQNNCPGNQNKEIISNEIYFILEPGMIIDNCDNIIQLNILDGNKKIISSSQLSIISKSIKKDNFGLTISSTYYQLNNNYPFQVQLFERNEINENYVYKYFYIMEDGEAFSLTNYMKNSNGIDRISIFPFCSNIKVRIKNDYGDVSEIISNTIKYSSIKFKSLTSILENYKINNIYNKESIWQILIELKTFFSMTNNKIDIKEEENNLQMVVDIIKKYLPLSIINENKLLINKNDLDENEDVIESNVYISLINQILLFYSNISNNTDYLHEKYDEFVNIIYNSLIDNNNAVEQLSEETILSYLRTIDNLLLIMKKLFHNYTELYEIINILKNILSKSVISGTKLEIDGNNFDIYLIRPGYYSEFFSISNNRIRQEKNKNNFTQFKDYKIINEKISNAPIQSGSNRIFSISRNNYDYLYDELTYLKNEEITDLIISVIRMNTQNEISENFNKMHKFISFEVNKDLPRLIMDYYFIIEIKNLNKNKPIENLRKLRYNLSFELDEKYENNISDIICFALNSLSIEDNNIEISKQDNCNTYIDSNNHKVICDCNTDGEIILLLDKEISSLIKEDSYKKHKFKILNNLSGSIILSSLALITFFSVVFIFYEFYEDKNNTYIALMNMNMRAQYEYENYKNLRNSNRCLFALYLLYYKYSFFNIFSTYKYNHPRYIRFFIEVIKILLNLLISIIPFYNKSFQKNDESNNEFIGIIDEENNEFRKKEIKFCFEDIFKSFFYSFMASIIIFFICHIIYKLLEFKKIRRIIWKPKKDILKECVYTNFKKEAVFNKKLYNIRKRILAFSKLCGNYISKNNKKDKFSFYLEYKFSQQNSNIPINDEDLDDSLIIKNNTSIESNLYSSKLNCINEPLINQSKTYKEQKKNLFKNLTNNIKSNNKKNNNLIISKGVQPFTLSQNIKNNISIWNIYRLESIRNKYIFNNSQNKQYYLKNDSKIIKYIDLYIETQKNYTYILSNDISFNQLSTTYNKTKIAIIRLINISLFASLLIIDIIILIIFNRIFEEYENYIIKNWLIPVLVQIFIINFIINYLFAVIASFLLFSYYKKRNNNCCFKVIFSILVEKYMRYLFKMRALINKYYREFENMK